MPKVPKVPKWVFWDDCVLCWNTVACEDNAYYDCVIRSFTIFILCLESVEDAIEWILLTLDSFLDGIEVIYFF